MARYELRTVGVFDRDTREHIKRGHPRWPDYEKWLTENGAPDPTPAEPAPPPRRKFNFIAAGAARDQREFERDVQSDPVKALVERELNK